VPGTLVASTLVVGAWGYMIFKGSIATIWPMFGVANQLLAAIALSVGTSVLFHMGKAKYTPITIVPMVFMIVTTLTATVELVQRFLGEANLKPEQAFTLRLDAALVGIVACLVLVILFDSLRRWRRYLAAGPKIQAAA
jgi:carbon starvation protein